MFSKIKFALLSVMSVILLNGARMAYFHYYTDTEGGGLTWMLFFFTLFAFDIISIISIFLSFGMIKKQKEEKLRKSARIVKLGSIYFWCSAYLYYVCKVRGFWSESRHIYMAGLFTALLGTTIFSLAYIRYLHKEKKLSSLKAIIFSVLQFIVVPDIITTLILTYSNKPKKEKEPEKEKKLEKNKKSVREILRFYLGSYSPPLFFGVIAEVLKQKNIPEKINNIGAFFVDQWRNHRVRCGIIIAVLCLIPIGLGAFRFYQSRLPQLISVSYRVQVPETTGDPENRGALAVFFMGSAATLELADSEVPDGMITINPPIEGVWTWMGDSALVFLTKESWKVGKKYTVTFAKNLFPSHIKTDNRFQFDIEDFSLDIIASEFYIDPEDNIIKRALYTVRTNYPLDTSSLERNINIEPVITSDSGSLKKRPYLYSLSYNEDHTLAYIVTEPLGMPAKSVDMRLRISAGVRDEKNEGSPAGTRSTTVEIPGMTSFVHVKHMDYITMKNDRQLYDRILVLETRGGVDPAELARNVTAYLLPKDLPELPGSKAQKDYYWDSLNKIVPEVLALSKKVNLEALPNEIKYSEINSWKFEADSGQFLYFKLNGGTRFYGGYVLDEPHERIFRIGSFPMELSILSEGSILSFSGDKRLSMMSRGIKDVEFKIGRIRPDDVNHFISQTYGDISNIKFNNYNFNQYNITEQYTESAVVPVASERDIGYFSFDFSRYLNNIPDKNLRHGLFIFTVRAKDGSYSDRRLIMVTDLGIFVKTGADSSKDVFVQSIASGNPVAGAAVNVLGLNGNPILSTYTDSSGRARIPAFSGDTYKNEREPTVYTVLSGEDMSFMAYESRGRNLDYSSFDVGGIRGASDPKTLRAFLFSDRGLYRPGDEARIGLVIKSGDWSVNLGGTPLEYRVTDPKGAEILNKRIKLSAEGVEEIRFSTFDWSPTGTYTTSVYVIQEYKQGDEIRERHIFLGSETVKVEEFLPDTLNVTAVFDPIPQDGWIAPNELRARVTVRNLFGTAASGNEVKAQINLAPGHQYFRQYRDYQFRDPYAAKNSFQEFLGTKTTNSEGTAEFNMNLAKFEKATYRLSFYTEAFEKGSGRNVSSEASVYVSPLPYLVGYKADGDLKYISRNAERNLSIIAINPKTQKTSVNDLTFTITELRYVTALVRQPNGVYKYQSIQKEYPISSKQITIPAVGLNYSLPTNTPGDYKLLITGPGDLEFNSLNFSIAGSENINRSLNRTAELEITLNKNDFRNGEEIELMIKAPYAGAGLITIERDKVYAYRWFRSGEETSMQTITVPAELEGNGYVNVHYLRSQDSPEIFMSPLSYGAVPFSISKENRTNRIKLDIPGEAKPGEDFVIKYSTSRKGKIIVFAVDEGILQLAGYRTPDPLAFFFRKRALEVRTAQILDMVLPRYSIVQSLAAMGGGAGYEELAGNLNPFKRKQNVPVAYWSGIIDAGPEVKELRYRVPDYFNGTIRVMAVAVNDSAIGAAEDRALIRSTFIISPNAPMLAAPGDEFDVSLTVTNNQKGAGEKGKVSLKVVPSEHFTISGNKEFNLDIPEGKDKTLTIQVKAAGKLGAAQIRFIASNGGETSELSAYMSVRPAVPYRVSLYSGAIKNKSAETMIDRNLYEEFNTREVSLSYLPMGIAKGLSFFLNNFPYGCSEQITSAVFPFLYPNLFKELGYTRTQADEGINRAIGILQARMKEDGTIGVWTSRSYDDPLITTYAAHFLTEARNANYYVSPAMMEKLLNACRNIASSQGTSHYDFTTRAYAIYILTRNEIVTTQLVESLKKDMNRFDESQTGIAGLYLAGTYALLQKTNDAALLLGKIKRAMAKDSSFRYIDELMYHSIYLNILSKHFPQRLRDISESLLVDMAAQMERQSYTTISANHALMAIDAYLKAVPTAETGRYTIQEVSKDNQRKELKAAGTTLFSAAFSANAAKIALENKDNLNLFYQITAAGFDRELPTKETKNGIEIFREFLDSSGKPVTSIKVGDVITVKLNFRSLSSVEYRDVAIVDLCPAGLETEIDSARQTERSSDGWSADYVDIREDRLVIYGTISAGMRSFSYRARAINAGTFTTPPLYAEAMYDKSVWALRPQASIKIVK